jgi:hypothetical protein
VKAVRAGAGFVSSPEPLKNVREFLGRNARTAPPPKEILDKYDLNKDGKLDESERATLRKDIEDGKFQPPPPPPRPGGPPPPDAPAQQ